MKQRLAIGVTALALYALVGYMGWREGFRHGYGSGVTQGLLQRAELRPNMLYFMPGVHARIPDCPTNAACIVFPTTD